MPPRTPIAESTGASSGKPSLIVTLRTPGRLAAQRAQTAIKRTMEEMDASDTEQTIKRSRSQTPSAIEDVESSQTDGSEAL